MHTRTMLLRHAGFVVDEAFTVQAALARIKSGSIDVLLICHTVHGKERRWLVSAVHEVRSPLPIICVSDLEVFQPDQGCLGTSNNPSQLITVAKRAVHFVH